jgi:hypothetical protein
MNKPVLEQMYALEDDARVIRAAMRENIKQMRMFADAMDKGEDGPGTPWTDEAMVSLYDTKKSLRNQLQQVESQLRGLENIAYSPSSKTNMGCVMGIPVSGNAKRELFGK